MVDMDKVIDRVLRGVYVSTGVVFADNVEDNIAEFTGGSGAMVSLGGVGVGLGVSVLADEVTDMVGMDRRGAVNDAIEFAGYGLQGASINNLLEATELQTGAGSASRSDVIQVDAQATRTTGSNGSQTGRNAGGGESHRRQVNLESP